MSIAKRNSPEFCHQQDLFYSTITSNREEAYKVLGTINYKEIAISNGFVKEDDFIAMSTVSNCCWGWITPTHLDFRIASLHQLFELLNTKSAVEELWQFLLETGGKSENLPILIYIFDKKAKEFGILQ